MEIIAHRGFWINAEEKNMSTAFKRAVENEFGVETDIREYMGKLKISHDIADDNSMSAADFFSMYRRTERTLAINIKADGLWKLLKEEILKNHISRYFCFDMSVPDTLECIKNQLKFFVRESEYEEISKLYQYCEGVWMDGFCDDQWITQERINRHIISGRRVCIVSPELHGRDYSEQWEIYRRNLDINNNSIILCTDYPGKARDFFYGKN